MNSTVKHIQTHAIPVLEKHGVVRSALFGSFVRGEEREDSDVDILVDLPRGKTLFDFVGLKLDLELQLKRPVDLVMYDAIVPWLKERVLKEQIPIYGSGMETLSE